MRISLPYEVKWKPQIPARTNIGSINGIPLLMFEGIVDESWDDEVGDRLMATQGDVWRRVQQMYFRARDDKAVSLRDDYEHVGLLAPRFGEGWVATSYVETTWLFNEPDGDDYDDLYNFYRDAGLGSLPAETDEFAATTTRRIQEQLHWFVGTTALLESISLKKMTFLIERCGWVAPGRHLLGEKEFEESSYFPGDWELWDNDVPLIVCEQHAEREKHVCLRTPKTEREILQGAWMRLGAECDALFEGFGAVTTIREQALRVECGGALDAAVIQWLSQEFGEAVSRTCAADDCFQTVPIGRKYCSPKCYERQKKRAYRRGRSPHRSAKKPLHNAVHRA